MCACARLTEHREDKKTSQVLIWGRSEHLFKTCLLLPVQYFERRRCACVCAVPRGQGEPCRSAGGSRDLGPLRHQRCTEGYFHARLPRSSLQSGTWLWSGAGRRWGSCWRETGARFWSPESGAGAQADTETPSRPGGAVPGPRATCSDQEAPAPASLLAPFPARAHVSAGAGWDSGGKEKNGLPFLKG